MQNGLTRLLGRAPHLIAVFLAFGFLAGCTMEYGTRPNIKGLQSLKQGESNVAQIRKALGPPHGKGAARFAEMPVYRTIWSYRFTRASLSEASVEVLLVFIRNDRYDGHLWFSAFEPVEVR